MYNRIILVGNLTREIDLRYMPSGSAVATTGIATSKKFKKQDGTQSEEVCFIDLTFFGRTAEVVNQYLQKGSKVLIEGRLKLDQWTDNNGQKRSKHSVVVESMQMLGNKPSSQHQENGNQPIQREVPVTVVHPNQTPTVDIDEDEIPF